MHLLNAEVAVGQTVDRPFDVLLKTEVAHGVRRERADGTGVLINGLVDVRDLRCAADSQRTEVSIVRVVI